MRGKFNLDVTFVTGDDIGQFEAAIRPNTALIYLESPTSMTFMLQELEKIAGLAKARGIKTIVDNSWATPLYQKPITYGIDLSVHTASKYMGGHSDIIAGIVAGNEPLIGRVQSLRERYGGILGPMEAWLATRGMRTLAVRLAAHGASASMIAQRLEAHANVRVVHYPGLKSHPQHALALKLMAGFTSPLSFELHCSNAEAREFVKRLAWFYAGPSWGGFESMVTVPSGESALVRIHVGLEDVETLWGDLEQSLNKVRKL